MISKALLNYTIIRKLGEGGMGEVYLALNPSIQQYVAIKRLHPRYGNNAAVRERFRQEAITLSSLSHRNIVHFLNYVENEDGVFLIMEYVDGCTLEEFINKKNGLIVEDRALPMIREMLDAFAAAHKQGIIHRDIKPSNIYLTKDGHIKVIDFGIADIIQDSISGGGETTAGTPEYMSPEQVLGRRIDKRSDIYSLGVLIHQMLTGRAPYETDSMSSLDVKRKVISANLPPMRNFYPYISEDIQRVVNKATEKDPNQRYADCQEMIDDLPDHSGPIKSTARHKSQWVIAAIVTGCVLLSAGIAFWIWDYNRLNVRYYSDYVEKDEIPQGIGKISASDITGRSEIYRMEFQKGKLRKMIAMNGYGDTIVPLDILRRPLRQAITEYYYSDEGKVDFKKVYDTKGKLLYKLDYEPNLKSATLKYDDDYGTPIQVGTLTKLLMEHDSVTGYLMRIAYADMHNRYVKDKDSVAVMRLDYFPNGRLKLISYLDTANNPTSISAGYGIRSFKYNHDGMLESVRYYDIKGHQTTDIDSISLIQYSYADSGRLTKTEYLGSDNKARNASNGVAKILYVYDDKDKKCETKYFDAADKSVVPKDPAEIRAKATSKDEVNKGKPRKKRLQNPLDAIADPYTKSKYGNSSKIDNRLDSKDNRFTPVNDHR